MSSTTTTINGTKASSSTAELRQLYHTATRAFIERDFTRAASSLSEALRLAPSSSPDAWFDPVLHGRPLPATVDLRRRLDILRITLVATLRSSPTPAITGGPALAPLLALSPARLLKTLWTNLLAPTTALGASDDAETDDNILPTPLAAFLHPSLAVSLTLAALKLDQPNVARQIAEAWLGSVDAEVEKLVWETSTSEGFNLRDEFPLDGVGSGSGGGMSASGMLGTNGQDGARNGKAEEARKAVVGGWLKLLDLLVLHVLPKLGEWEAAGDFVRLQGVENGGWVPDERVEGALRRLEELQREEVHAAAARIQRQKDLDAARAQKKREPRTASADKGKGKAREASPTTSSGSSPSDSPKKSSASGSRRTRSKSTSPAQGSTPKSSPPLSSSSGSGGGGFGGLRSSLSSYLGRPSSHSNSTSNGYPPSSPTSSSFSNPVSTFIAYLRYSYSADPIRILSIVTFLFAFTTWARRRVLARRARGERGLGMAEVLRLAVGKVGETVKMATKVTAL